MKHALITGASRGIGKACAEKFASMQYELTLICKKNLEPMQTYAEKLSAKYNIPCHVYSGDISDAAFVREVFSSISSLDVLINNAGISRVGLITDMDDATYRELMGTNLDGCFYCNREAARLMLQRKTGSIVNVSSVWGNVGGSTEVAYSASKGGINALTKALAKELAPSHIRVNAVAPGIIDTDMNACFSAEDLSAIAEEVPMGRLGTPDEVSELIYDVANGPAYLTGQIITIDGGWM